MEDVVGDFWKGRTALVTGGTGFVGSHLVERLVELGASVIVPVRSVNVGSYFFAEKLNEKSVLVNCDIKEIQRIKDIIAKYGVSIVFHLAAQSLVTVGRKEPYETMMTNIVGTLNILESCRTNPDVEAILLASSDKAYGSSNMLPYLETHPLKGEYPYDSSKSCMDLVSQCYHRTYDMAIAIARFGNIYGEGDLNFDRIIPGAIRSGLLNTVLEIRSDGQMIREYTYAKDVVDGYLVLAEKIEKIRGEAFNFTSGERKNVLEVVETVSKAMGKDISFRIMNTAKHEIREQYLSAEKAHRILNWTCKYDMNSVLLRIVEWYKRYFRLK